MKAQCCICSDLFDQDGDANISAVACGHTFHEVCLMKWLDTSSTCPHCRKRVNQKHIVKKLYFDKAEDYDETTDNPEKLINEVDQLRLELRKKQKHAEEVEENKERLNQRIEDILSAKKAVEKQYKKEQTSNNCLRKQLAFYESQQRALESEREEYKSVKNKLLDMKSVQNLLEGCDSDAQELLSQYGEGEGSVRQLATYCAVLKREYDKSKTEKKLLKDELEKRRKDLLAKERALSDKVKQVSTLEDQLRYSENDLKFAEKERELLKQKIRRLKQDLQSPCSTASASFVKAYTEENIMPSTPVSLQKPQDGSKIIDLADDFDMDVCTDAALTPDIIPPSPHSSLKRQCEENDLQYVKISSASDKQQTKRVKSEMSDISNLAAMNIFKNKARPDYSSTVRRGCNGLGGYTTYVQPTGFGKFLSKKPSSKPRANIKPLASRASKKTPLPDYPKLDLFLGKD